MSGFEDDGQFDQTIPYKRPPRVKPIDVVVLCFIPWFIFSLLVSLFAFAYDSLAALAWILSVMIFLLAVLLAAAGVGRKRPFQTALGCLCLASVAVGIPVGFIVSNEFMFQYWRLGNGATYELVDPAEPAMAHGDAAIIVFSEGAFVNSDRSVGYMKVGTVYCVAPIATSSQTGMPQNWAVGKDCCDQRGKFSCNSAADDTARSGVVLQKSRSDWEHYRNAVRMAEAAYEMEPQPTSLFVEWTANAAVRRDSLLVEAWALVGGACAMYLLASLGASIVLARTLSGR